MSEITPMTKAGASLTPLDGTERNHKRLSLWNTGSGCLAEPDFLAGSAEWRRWREHYNCVVVAEQQAAGAGVWMARAPSLEDLGQAGVDVPTTRR